MDYKSWIFALNADKPRFLHTALRVRNIDAALRFYVDGLGLMLFDRIEIEHLRVTALFLGFEVGAGFLELVCYWDTDAPYTHRPGYNHAAIGVPNLNAILDKLEAMGVEITSRPSVSIQGAAPAAFVKDADGYALELVQIRNG
jgi:lactoylglutathione lyase